MHEPKPTPEAVSGQRAARCGATASSPLPTPDGLPLEPVRDDEAAELSDEELFDRYRHGDARAFEHLLTRHARSVYNFSCRFLGERGRSEDIFQEVFLRVVRGAPGFRGGSKFTTWLYRITRNVCTDLLRSRSKPAPLSLDGSGVLGDGRGPRAADRAAANHRGAGRMRLHLVGSGRLPSAGTRENQDGRRSDAEAIPDPAANVDLDARRRETLEVLEVAIGELPEPQREVLLLRQRVGLPFEDIGEIVGAPRNTVKSRMRYALENLRRALLRTPEGAAILRDGI